MVRNAGKDEGRKKLFFCEIGCPFSLRSDLAARSPDIEGACSLEHKSCGIAGSARGGARAREARSGRLSALPPTLPPTGCIRRSGRQKPTIVQQPLDYAKTLLPLLTIILSQFRPMRKLRSPLTSGATGPRALPSGCLSRSVSPFRARRGLSDKSLRTDRKKPRSPGRATPF